MTDLRIAIIADTHQQALISSELSAYFTHPHISNYDDQVAFERSVKLYNYDVLIAQDAMVSRGFFTQLLPLLELIKIPLLIIKDAETAQSFKSKVVYELIADEKGHYVAELAPLVTRLIDEQLALTGQSKILFVEDEEIDITFIKRRFVKVNPKYECDIVTSIADLRIAIADKKYDIIVSDFNLPDGDAFDSIKLAHLHNTPIVIVTAQGSERTAVELMRSGAADYLVKDKITGEHMLVLPGIVKSVLNLKKLEAYNSGLVEMLRLKNQDLERFAHIIAHDLRSPIASCVLLIHTLQLLGEDLSEDLQETIGLLTDVSNKITNTIDGIFQYTVLDAQSKAFAGVDMNNAAHEALENLSIKVKEAGAVVNIENLPTVNADYVQMVQLFQNLIGNGIKYRGDNIPSITVSCAEQNGEQIFKVTDNGIGIAKKDHKKIFDVFSRLHASTSKYEGVGMGLTIVKRILERHNGKIWVESDVGEGTSFFFCLVK